MRQQNQLHQPFRHYVFPGGREALSYVPFPNDPTPPFFGWLDSETPTSKTFVGSDGVTIVVSQMKVDHLVWMKVFQGDPGTPTFLFEGPSLPPQPYYSNDAGNGRSGKRSKRRHKHPKGRRRDGATSKRSDSNSRTSKQRPFKQSDASIPLVRLLTLSQNCSTNNNKKKRGPGGLVTTSEHNGFLMKVQ